MKTWGRRLLWSLGLLLGLLLCGGIAIYWLLESSLPVLSGEQELAGLGSEVNVARDALGVPVIRARDRLDAARALGFLHAQERFFQMDLSRRRAAGELAALVGKAALEVDKSARVHRFRHRARLSYEQAPSAQRDLIDAYTGGVNAGLQALGQKPFEYFLLRAEPESWRSEDVILVGYAMYFTLQNSEGGIEFTRKLAREKLPPALFDWLTVSGSEWDAPLFGEAVAAPALPTAEQLAGWSAKLDGPIWPPAQADAQFPGSNSWAVSGARTGNGAAMLANDMHLGLSVPNTWYRAQLWYGQAGEERRVTGATLPGTPVVVVGSNTQIAWGFTNSYGDWADVIALDLIDAQRYRSSDGEKSLSVVSEQIAVKGGDAVELKVEESIWGPVIRRVSDTEAYVLRWVAHDPGRGMDLGLQKLESARSSSEALTVAKEARVPAQNFVVADREGAIGWTLIGAMPRRIGYDGRDVVSWSDGSKGWDGYLGADEYPEVQNPLDGRIWTANNRVASGEMLARIGDGGYDLGARALQIRDRLREREQFSERDLLAIQIDDEARFLQRWQQHVLQLLDADAVNENAARGEFRQLVADWGGRAQHDSSGYRFVRGFRLLLKDSLFRAWLGEVIAADAQFNPRWLSSHWEAPLWQTLQQQPAHLLPRPYTGWRALQLAVVDALIDAYRQQGDLAARQWGERNTAAIRHPLSRSLPLLSTWLDAPADALSGDSNMPYVQGPAFGASERIVVSPGHEDQGIFHMPTGQSGHPLSPFYMAGHAAWVKGEPAPFLPGAAVYQLTLKPAVTAVK